MTRHVRTYIRVDRDRERMESIEIVISEKRSGEWRGNDIVDRIFVPTSLPFYNTLVKSRFYGVILFIAFEPFPSGVTVNYVALHFPEQTPANLCDVETIFKLEGGPVGNDWTPGTRWKHGAWKVEQEHRYHGEGTVIEHSGFRWYYHEILCFNDVISYPRFAPFSLTNAQYYYTGTNGVPRTLSYHEISAMLRRREEKIEEKESILSGIVAAGFVTNVLLQTQETFLFNVIFEYGNFYEMLSETTACTLEI